MIVNALPASLGPGEKFRILVKFTPGDPVEYHETYVITTASVNSQETKLHVNLRGRGLGPKWKLEGIENGIVRFGTTKINNTLQQPIFLLNEGDFALEYTLVLYFRPLHKSRLCDWSIYIDS